MEFKATLPIVISRQGSRYVAYCPVLDISTSGKTEAQAKERFGKLVPLFFEELGEAGTTHDVLTEMGWTPTGQTANRYSIAGWKQPKMKNEQVQVNIPVAA